LAIINQANNPAVQAKSLDNEFRCLLAARIYCTGAQSDLCFFTRSTSNTFYIWRHCLVCELCTSRLRCSCEFTRVKSAGIQLIVTDLRLPGVYFFTVAQYVMECNGKYVIESGSMSNDNDICMLSRTEISSPRKLYNSTHMTAIQYAGRSTNTHVVQTIA
jgi:hypothetical protein